MKLTFKYLDIKGLGEPVRLAMTVGGLPFEDVRLSYDEVRALKATADDITKHAGSPFGQVPVLEIDGVAFGQSGALLRWVARDERVIGWVRHAAGDTREELQWQKYEDTSTAYWLSYAPERIAYLDIGPLIHDASCHVLGDEKRYGGALMRPVANNTLLGHNLKQSTAFDVAYKHMQGVVPYDHADCVASVWGAQRPTAEQVERERERELERIRKKSKRRSKGAKKRARERKSNG